MVHEMKWYINEKKKEKKVKIYCSYSSYPQCLIFLSELFERFLKQFSWWVLWALNFSELILLDS